MSRENIYGLSREAIAERLTALGAPAFRARQVYRWIYAHRVTSFEGMTNLSVSLRQKLASRFDLAPPSTVERHVSLDGTVRRLLRLSDERRVETVYIPEPRRATVCLSTQVGCPLKCSFCFSGTVKLERNLDAGEIVGQFVRATEDVAPLPSRINVVYMGMGEPLLNADAVIESLRILIDPDGFAVSPRRITVSTAGMAEELPRFVERAPPVGIAVSLHAATNAKRDLLMPINRRHPIEELLATTRRLPLSHRRLLTFEYVLLGGENDAPEDAEALSDLVEGDRAKINLISYNPWPGSPHRASTPERTNQFMERLAAGGHRVSLRRSRGDDVLAACGQLAGQLRSS